MTRLLTWKPACSDGSVWYAFQSKTYFGSVRRTRLKRFEAIIFGGRVLRSGSMRGAAQQLITCVKSLP